MLREGEKLEKAGHCRRQGGLGAFRVVGRGRERQRPGEMDRRRQTKTERQTHGEEKGCTERYRKRHRDTETETERLD